MIGDLDVSGVFLPTLLVLMGITYVLYLLVHGVLTLLIVSFAVVVVWRMVMYYMFAPWTCLLYTSPSPRDQRGSRMPSSA